MNTIPELGAGVCKFGRNPEVDAAGVADVWDGGGDSAVPDYPWPAAAAATTTLQLRGLGHGRFRFQGWMRTICLYAKQS